MRLLEKVDVAPRQVLIDAKIYEVLEKLAERHGADILYLDDRPENVAAGAARGWRTILHESPEKSRVALEQFL